MNLLDSLLDAIVRLDGDALVMHVGEKPYVVTTSEATGQFRGPLAWGQVELSSRTLTCEAVAGMLGQILPIDHRAALAEYGATEYAVSAANDAAERFTIVAARGGDDIWLEVRRHRKAAEEPAVAEQVETAETVGAAAPGPESISDAAQVSDRAHLEDPVAVSDVHDGEVAETSAALRLAEASEAPRAAKEAKRAEPAIAIATPPAMARDDEPSFVAEEVEAASAQDALRLQEEPPDAFISDIPLEDDVFVLDPDMIAAEAQSAVGDQDWTDDVMTEGELGEILRASAAAIITGETDEHVHDFTGAELDQPLTIPDVPFAPPGRDEPLVVAEDSVDSSLAAEEVESGEPPPSSAEKDPALAAREALLAEQEELWGRLDAEAAVMPKELASVETGTSAPLLILEAAGESEFVEAPETEPEPELRSIAVQEPIPVAAEQPGEPHVEEQPEGAPEALEEEAPVARPAAVVLPLTRPVRVEAAADSRGAVGTIERVLRLAATRGAANVYLVAHSAPMVRVDGEFSPLEGEPAVNAALLERITSELAPRGRDGVASSAAEWVVDVPEIGRVRCMSFRDHRGPGLIFRMVPSRAIAADQLGLPAEVQALCSEAEGLVLVAGGRGSGKSTLLTSFVDLINRTRSDHVITIESQIEFVHENDRSFISQRELRGDGEAVAAAVRAACREEPDVLIVEDLRTPELVSLALEAAEAGRLVFASVLAPSTVVGIERIIEMFPPERREKVQASLSGVLRGVVSQLLLRRLKGGRVAAREVLLNTPAVANLILEGETFQLPAALENGRRSGMMPFAESLAALVRDGIVHAAHAYRRAPNRDQFLAILRREGIDVSIAERLA